MGKATPDTFAVRLKTLRESRGLSVAGLADAAGLNRTHLYHLEAGTRSPTWDVVCKLADALGVATDAFRARSS